MAARFGLAILICASLVLSVCGYTPVNVMMPLNIMNTDGTVNNAQQLQQQLTTLKQKTNVDGILLDVWFGIVERNEKQYDWNGYKQLVQLFRQVGLGVKVVLSFHQCGGNVGDACNIPLPKWVTSVGPDAFYTDREGRVNYEYISAGADEIPLWNGRTASDIYTDFMISFRDQVLANNTDIISLVEISLGPAGELRYPSYPSKYWNFCGVGEFQCYDKYMLANLSAAASVAGHGEWGHGGPSNAGQYSDYPQNTGFFSNGNDNYQSPYGRFFLNWYFNVLLNHADLILGNAANIYGPYPNTTVAAKISGVHWWYKTDHHAAELTAGYYNTNGQNPYLEFARLFAKHKVAFEFTCMEMKDQDQPSQCQCGPEELVSVTHSAAQSQGVVYGGENALPIYDTYHYGQIEYQASQHGHIGEFTYLRFSQDLLNDNNIGNFADFVNRMHNI